MSRKMYLFAALVLLVLLTSGCDKAEKPTQNAQASPTEAPKPITQDSAPPALLGDRVAYDLSTLQTVDLDGDGSADQYTLTFPTREVAEGLTLDRTVDHSRQDDGSFQGEILLRFENTGNAGPYVHEEYIPKEFAASVDELCFSVPPTQVIEADPRVSWQIDTDDDTQIRISSTKSLDSDAFAQKRDSMSVGFDVQTCMDLREDDYDEFRGCFLSLVEKYRDNKEFNRWLEEYLNEARDEGNEKDTAVFAAAEAIVRGDYSACEKYLDGDARTNCVLDAFIYIGEEECVPLLEKGKPDAQQTRVLDCARSYYWRIGNAEDREWICSQLKFEPLKLECAGEPDVSL